MYVSASFIHIDFFSHQVFEKCIRNDHRLGMLYKTLRKITHRGLYIRSAIFTQPNVVDGLGLKRFVSIVLSQLSASYFSRHLGTSHAIDLVIRSAVKHYQPAIKLTLLQLLRYALGKWLITI